MAKTLDAVRVPSSQLAGKWRTNRISWSPSGWPQTAEAPTGTGVLTLGCPGAFRALRVGIPNAGTLPYTIAKIAACPSSSWNDYVNPTGDSSWRSLTFAGRGAPSDEIVTDRSAPIEITAWPAPAIALPGSGISPRWTWTDWIPLQSASPDPATGMHVVMLRWLNAVAGQKFTYANGLFGRGWTGLAEVNRGFDYAVGGYNNGADYVTNPVDGDVNWEACQHNSPLNGTPLAIIQFLTERGGIVGMVAGDSHQSGTGTTSSFNGFLAQFTTDMGRKYRDQVPFGFVNCAVGGIASQEIFAHLDALLPEVRPTFAVLPGWTYNDLHAGVHIDPLANGVFLTTLLRAANQCRQNDIAPIFLTPFPRDQASMTTDVLRSWHEMRVAILRLRSEGALVVDGGAVLGRLEGGQLTGTYLPGLSDDGIHPNDAGHALVAEELAHVVESIAGLHGVSAMVQPSAPLAAEPVADDQIPIRYNHRMKTLLFCTSYAETPAVWDERWGRWLKAVVNSGIEADKILIVDDGSPVLPSWPDVAVVPAESQGVGASKVEIRHFADRRGQHVNGEPFPGWYRSFSHAVLYAIKEGFDRIIHIEADAFLISDRAIEFFNACDRGWVGLWCARHRWPETTMQIINKDQFASCEAFFGQPYSAHLGLPYKAVEQLIPFTSINKTLIGDRYGEGGDTIPYGADYVSQVKWNKGPDYYWWMSDDGVRMPPMVIKSDLRGIVDKYGRDESSGISHTGVDYREFMRFLDDQMIPRSYLEIGTHEGDSLLTMSCDAICIDPNFLVARNVLGGRKRSLFFQMTSDDFFDDHDPKKLLGDIDLGFLDGLHHFEALLKDFINFERNSHAGSVALIHDCLPLNTRMAGRVHQTGPDDEPAETRSFWTGDVWRILPILQEFRPDLTVVLLDCPPTGLVLCTGLDNRSTELVVNFETIVQRYAQLALDDYGLARLWASFQTLSTRKITSDPRAFCEHFGFRSRRTVGSELTRIPAGDAGDMIAPPPLTLKPQSSAPRFTSIGSWLQAEIPILVPCFNNPTYARNMLKQLQVLGFGQVVIIDNASTSPDMRNWLGSLGSEVTVISLPGNFGPHHIFHDTRTFALLPRYFCVTDPDLSFNPALPDGFLGDLAMLTTRHRIGKAGFALDISDREAMRDDVFDVGDRKSNIWEWEAQFWEKPLEPLESGDKVYDAKIDTTFALYDKKYFDPDTFLSAVRVAGRFTARHLPWYRDRGLPEVEAAEYERTQRFSSYHKRSDSSSI